MLVQQFFYFFVATKIKLGNFCTDTKISTMLATPNHVTVIGGILNCKISSKFACKHGGFRRASHNYEQLLIL